MQLIQLMGAFLAIQFARKAGLRGLPHLATAAVTAWLLVPAIIHWILAWLAANTGLLVIAGLMFLSPAVIAGFARFQKLKESRKETAPATSRKRRLD